MGLRYVFIVAPIIIAALETKVLRCEMSPYKMSVHSLYHALFVRPSVRAPDALVAAAVSSSSASRSYPA